VRKLLALLALVVAAVGAAVATFTAVAVPTSAVPLSLEHSPVSTSFSVLQMNLCLSGHADCYPAAAYPSILDEAIAQIIDNDPTAVTLNEACSGDAAKVARRTGYRMRFATVLVDGAPLPCVNPGGRGRFGNAVLTRERLTASDDRAFATQVGAEERRWLCATTSRRVSVCTAHLGTRGSADERRTNDGQCAELEAVLAEHAKSGPTVFGGDINRHAPCAPASMWPTTDDTAAALPGLQHIYASRPAQAPLARVSSARHTDHDFLFVRWHLQLTPRE
jgi:endonuclease/exonuclease/phosphatase family metal-dependent hydrolase